MRQENDYSDLYGPAVIELKEDPSFKTVLSYFSDTEEITKDFTYKGRKIIAKRKFTYKGGGGKMFQIKTNYLHVWLVNEEKPHLTQHYKQDKNGDFNLI